MEKRKILKLNFEQRMGEELQLLSSLRVGVLRTEIILHQTGPTDACERLPRLNNTDMATRPFYGHC